LSTGCCADGWTPYRSHCYFLAYGVQLNFAEAQRFCKARGAYLTRLDTYAENLFLGICTMSLYELNITTITGLSTFTHFISAMHTWMGLSDRTHESIWRWADTNEHATFSEWFPGQPDNLNNEDCVGFNAAFGNKWNDYPCHSKLTPLCERS
ncbi:perlucin-like protein, partial [Mercenaria mercenaria]|uniref:perlucin-like protein n=1 Tax=Mercenaria mercenaria TaxID=6596 RepID=UPI00234EA139